MKISKTSLSARRAWIEIKVAPEIADERRVALREESVDRNDYLHRAVRIVQPVALREESVDRNSLLGRHMAELAPVALREESVDRNKRNPASNQPFFVALREESVDRNKNVTFNCIEV